MIEAIIFDFGNVICALDRKKFLTAIAPYSNKSAAELDILIYGSSYLDQFEHGAITPHLFYTSVAHIGNLTLSYQAFLQAYTNIFTPIETTIDLIKKLKSNYKLALLSNTNEIHYELYIKKTDIFPFFDAVTVSHKVHAMKPEEEIFRDCLEKLAVKPVKCIYIDDIAEYVKAGNDVWLNAHQYQTHEKLMQFLHGHGVSV